MANVSNLANMTLSTLADSLVASGILGLLLWFEPVGAIAVGALMLTGTWILDRTTRRRVRRWGQLSHDHTAKTLKHLGQGVHGAKDVKIFGRERQFIQLFASHRATAVEMAMRQGFVTTIPRLWYELLAVGGLCALAAVMLWQGTESRAMIPVLGLFAASAFRLLPLVNRLANSLQALRFAGPGIETIRSELALGEVPLGLSSAPMGFHHAIALTNVCYRYQEAPANAVEGISLEIPRGAAVGIIGGSGAGKSTLIDVVLGLLTPTAGSVTVDGVDIATNIRGWQCQIGYVPQSIYLCDDTIRRNVAFGVPDESVNEAAVRRAIRAAQLDAFIEQLPEGMDTVVGERGVRLSGGQRQRIGIARALYHDPQVLVLDEATSALDAETERDFMQDVEAMHGEKTMLIVAHRLTTVSRCDILYRLERGRIVAAGSYTELVGK
jgi:ABC-type multidrug transport system fused ATPase/permease subunit